MNHPTADALTLEASAVVELIEQTPECRDCDGYRMVHVDRDEHGDLDLNIVIAHDPTCPALNGVVGS